MTQEEKYIHTMAGRNNAFRVPEGYFDQLAGQVMDSLPEREPVTVRLNQGRTRMLRPLLYAAASLCLVVLSAVFYFNSGQQNFVSTAAVQTSADAYVDEAADYVMADNQDIYACLAYDNY